MMPSVKKALNIFNTDLHPEMQNLTNAPKILTLNLVDSSRSRQTSHNNTSITGNENVKSSECSSSGCYDAVPLVAHLQVC